MITLSNDFAGRATRNDTRSFVAVQLYYGTDPDELLRISTIATSIYEQDNLRQYLGVVKSISGFSQKWNILKSNNTTVSTPKINVSNYDASGANFNIMSEINNQNFYGQRLVIYYGYEGQILSDMLKVFDGTTADITFQDNELVITGKPSGMTEASIEGRYINKTNNMIGTEDISGLYKVLGWRTTDTEKAKYVPVIFGRHWCAPAVAWGTDVEALGGNILYAVDDQSMYCPDICSARAFNWYMPTVYQNNIGRTEQLVYVLNDKYYVPIHIQGWSSDSEVVYEQQLAGNGLPAGFNILNADSNHFRSDKKIFIVVPLAGNITNLGNDIHLNCTDTTATPTLTQARNIFNTDWSEASFPRIVADGEVPIVTFKANYSLSTTWNLKGGLNGRIYPNRKISTLSTSDFNDGDARICGRIDYTGILVDDTTLFCFLDNYTPTPVYAAIDAGDTGRTEYIGQSFYNSDNYNQNTRVFGDNLGDIYDENYTFTDFNANEEDFEAYGTADVTAKMGSAPGLNREALERNVVVRAEFRYTTFDTLDILKLYHINAGSVSLNPEDNLYVTAEGIMIDDGDSLESTSAFGADYVLKRPFEYIELILLHKDLGALGDYTGFAGLQSKWTDLFGQNRDYSGFCITEPTKLNDFMGEYIKYEPFTLFCDETGVYKLPLIKYKYESADIQGTLDYNDATDFQMYLSPFEDICTEIKELSTDYMYGLDDYSLKMAWRLTSASYTYNFWAKSNTLSNNQFFIDKLEKKYTSQPEANMVYYSGRSYTCIRTHTNVNPESDTTNTYWIYARDAYPGDYPSWSAGETYYGADRENRAIALWYLNQHANRHRMVKFTTNQREYFKYQVGDIVAVSRCPHTLLGMEIQGFNNNTNFTSSINGQTVYGCFIITSTQKDLNKITIEAMQCHRLDTYDVERVG